MSPQKARPRIQAKYIYFVLIVLQFLIITRSAWMSDDAYITYRSISNLFTSGVLSWNLLERVQTFTHPLWMILLSLIYGINREAFLTPIILSIVLSVLSVSIFAFRSRSKHWQSGVIAILILLLSKSFTDFSTSGLENPLSFLILTIFFFCFLSNISDMQKIKVCTLTGSMAVLTRFDNFLIVAPAFAFIYINVITQKKLSIKQTVMTALKWFSPLAAWLIFCTFYYGSPLPNTYLAKINTGLPMSWYMERGFNYYFISFVHDPISLIAILFTLIAIVFMRSGKLLAIAAGILLHLVYVLGIGGGFMAGRFFTVPLIVAMISLAHIKFHRYVTFISIIAALLIGLTCNNSTISRFFTQDNNNFHITFNNSTPLSTDIIDERNFYIKQTGLWALSGFRHMINHNIYTTIFSPEDNFRVVTAAGIIGYICNPKVHMLDVLALNDPLLARIPLVSPVVRIGHFTRSVPRGYIPTLRSGENKITNPCLAEYYKKVAVITRGDLFSLNRIKTIIEMNLGSFTHLIKQYKRTAYLQDFVKSFTVLKNQNIPIGRAFDTEGIEIILRLPRLIHSLDISLTKQTDYKLELLQSDKTVFTTRITHQNKRSYQYKRHILEFPDTLRETKISKIKIIPVSGYGAYYIGHLRID